MGLRPHGRRAADRGVAVAAQGAAAARCDFGVQRAYRGRRPDRRRLLGIWKASRAVITPHSHAGASFAMGTMHGLAGQLALIWRAACARVFRSSTDSMLYLAGFGLGAIAGMSAFAAGLGLASIRHRPRFAGCSMRRQRPRCHRRRLAGRAVETAARRSRSVCRDARGLLARRRDRPADSRRARTDRQQPAFRRARRDRPGVAAAQYATAAGLAQSGAEVCDHDDSSRRHRARRHPA